MTSPVSPSANVALKRAVPGAAAPPRTPFTRRLSSHAPHYRRDGIMKPGKAVDVRDVGTAFQRAISNLDAPRPVIVVTELQRCIHCSTRAASQAVDVETKTPACSHTPVTRDVQ